MCVLCIQAEAARSSQAAAQAKLSKAEESAASAAQKLKVCPPLETCMPDSMLVYLSFVRRQPLFLDGEHAAGML